MIIFIDEDTMSLEELLTENEEDYDEREGVQSTAGRVLYPYS